ncbi:hypothetical protein [uncultured Megasphaera sp.]|uniref:hypothetical protein n=1 Tax=uncultured Megasphaera sp. TaxID=165188 RepID=UPI0026595B93|nr:hypothetical protein [uncultured Megasphaera sp.]
MIRLGEVADIVSGYNVGRGLVKEAPERKYSRSDFEHDFYRMKEASLTNPIIYQSVLETHNMVAAIISDDNKDRVISQAFSILTIQTDKIHPWYLCYLLNESEQVARQSNVLGQGSNLIQRLSAHQMKQIEIPLIPMKKQETIGRLYVTAVYQYYLEITKAAMKRQGICNMLHHQEQG